MHTQTTVFLHDVYDIHQRSCYFECTITGRRRIYRVYHHGTNTIYMQELRWKNRLSCLQGRRKIDNLGGGGGGHIFIYACSQTVKTINFKILISILKEINWA